MRSFHPIRGGVGRRCAFALAVGVVTFAAPQRAQGQSNLSGQGLGYPPGQVSARAHGLGSALGEIDPLSQLNPASISAIGATTLFVQLEPEFQRVSFDTLSDRTTTARYPLFSVNIPVGSEWVVGLSSATLLDRTWVTSTPGTVIIDGQPFSSTFNTGSDGSINDLRLAGAWLPNNWFRLGLGGHLMTGNDRIFVGRTFVDEAFATFADTSIIGFDGGAVSAGMELIAPRIAILAASYRQGFNLNANRSDTSLGHARVPNRFGASLAYIGLTGTQIVARTSYDEWSALNGFRNGGALAVNAWDTSVGAEFTGARFAGQPWMLRAGARWRTMPYEALGSKVTEKSLSGGIGTLFAGGRVLTDLALIRAQRNAGVGVSENSWTVSIGLGVRP